MDAERSVAPCVTLYLERHDAVDSRNVHTQTLDMSGAHFFSSVAADLALRLGPVKKRQKSVLKI